ncbi:glucokinase [Dethiosulfatibacter aminovorans DSM 17477]|uniref:Glucokinase n=1 Tax=Dethiosulfatibacter aminovorans DSM 17477 TaxID=1121476 RepID=A0A1M6FVB1_9FIRM|nr:ROK family protein [Dethiosulfatibacter aminovorans]SHJ01681.1 glucokinase [Dethiosulfatibacter aminovorans DSM 17477]
MNFIGIDLGGTNLRVGIIDERGRILEKKTATTEGDKGPEFVINKIIDTVRSLEGFSDAVAVGIGVPGAVDYENGLIPCFTNIPGWEDVKLKTLLEEAFGKKVYLENDANAAGYSEAIIGAGKGCNIVQYMTISTGVGGGLIIDGKVIRGQSGNASEIAKIILPSKYDFDKVGDSNLENLASGTAIGHFGRKLIDGVDDASDVFRLYGEGHLLAMDIIDHALESLARGISNISFVVEPDIFVLGGGVMNSLKPFLGELMNRARTYMPKRMGERLKIVPGILEEPGMIGVVLVAAELIKNTD